jgi:predicted porin
MKKSLIALAVLAASGAAMAQSSVTLYGRLDASFGTSRTETTGAAPAAELTQTKIDQSNLNTTFWGLKGTEDLGGGLTANFKLESGFALDTGVGNTGIFERTATVGFAGGFGAVNLGRQYTAYDALRGATNNVWDSNMSTTGTVWKTGMADYTNRISNSVRYDSPTFSGVSGAVAIGLGEDKTATVDASQSLSLHIKYAAGPLLVGYGYQEEKAQTFAAAIPPAAAVANGTVTNKYNLLGASYDFGVAKLTGSYNQAKNGTLEDKEYQVGVSVPFGKTTVAAGYAHSNSTGAALELNGKGFTLVGTYDLSKRTSLYAGYKATEVEKGAAAITTDKASTLALGVRHTF